MHTESENSLTENQNLAKLAGKLADAITDLESGKGMNEKEKEELTQILLEDRLQNIDNKIIEAQRGKLLGLLLFVEPVIPTIDDRVRGDLIRKLAKKHSEMDVSGAGITKGKRFNPLPTTNCSLVTRH